MRISVPMNAAARRLRPSQSLFALVVLAMLCGAIVGWYAFGARPRDARAAGSGDATDGLGVSYVSRLTDGTGASARTRLFDDAPDRAAQIQALREDDEDARFDPGHATGYAENKLLFAACGPEAPLDTLVQCNGRTGYILHLALRGNADAVERSAAIDRYGARWAKIFERYHPDNQHCALVVLSSDVTAEDETENDDAGNGIISSRCFR